MGKQSGFMAKQLAIRQAFIEASERITRQLMLDTLQITLHREFGFGYDRILKVTDEWSELYNFFHDALSKNVEADYLQERLDREISDILKDKQPLIPFKERYPDIKQITYEPRRKKHD